MDYYLKCRFLLLWSKLRLTTSVVTLTKNEDIFHNFKNVKIKNPQKLRSFSTLQLHTGPVAELVCQIFANSSGTLDQINEIRLNINLMSLLQNSDNMVLVYPFT